uniref:G_PROTEIN_RECEP_F1_2 domain-containing protein n=1 Tax=Strongyloides venezuelensis TaxID=75913 RepID=A0A0K0FLV8_STRVS
MLTILVILYYLIVFLGVLTNGYTFWYYFFVLKKKNSYSLICISFISGNLFVLIPNFLWLLFEETKLYSPSLIGQIVIFGYYSGTLGRLILSLNRLFAIHIPFKYKEIFSNKHTYFYLSITWIIGLIMIIPLSLGDYCYFIFIDRIWSYGTTNFCIKVSYIQDFLYGVTIGSIIIFIDIITASILIKKNITKLKNKINVKINKSSNRKRRNIDINIFLRTVISNIFLVLSLISFHYFSLFNVGNFDYLFVTTSMFWMFHHFLDGTIVGLFNYDVKKHFLLNFKKDTKIISHVETTRNPHMIRRR